MKKILCVLMAGCILAYLLSGCSNSQSKIDYSAETPEAELPIESETEGLPFDLPNTDYNGASVTIMSALVEGTDTSTRFAEFFYDEELAGEGVNDAVFQRNSMVEDILNVIILNNDVKRENISGVMKKNTSSGDTSIDIYTPLLGDLLGVITDSYLINLYDMPGMDIENPWWDSALNRDLGIAGKMYMQGGDILFSFKEQHAFMGVNKKLLTQYNIEIPYDIVLEGKWTLDVLHDLCCNLTDDLNGDGVLDHNDRFGYTHTSSSSYSLFVAAGGCVAELNSEGKPVFTNDMEKNIAVLEKLSKIYSDQNIFYDVNKMPDGWNTNREMFMNDQVVFRPASIYNLQSCREMVSDFGILPYPKYDENQEEYLHCPGMSGMQVIAIPVTNMRLELTGSVLETLAYYSKDTTVEAYYEANLHGKVSRDDKSRQMLDVIFTNVIYDLSYTYGWGQMEKVVCDGVKDPSKFVSRYAIAEKLTKTAMDETYSYFVGE